MTGEHMWGEHIDGSRREVTCEGARARGGEWCVASAKRCSRMEIHISIAVMSGGSYAVRGVDDRKGVGAGCPSHLHAPLASVRCGRLT